MTKLVVALRDSFVRQQIRTKSVGRLILDERRIPLALLLCGLRGAKMLRLRIDPSRSLAATARTTSSLGLGKSGGRFTEQCEEDGAPHDEDANANHVRAERLQEHRLPNTSTCQRRRDTFFRERESAMSAKNTVSEIFDASRWQEIEGLSSRFTDLTFHRGVDRDAGTVRIAFHRPEVRNAFRPNTVDELYNALEYARMMTDVGCVLITGNGPSPKDGGWAFCSGGDQRIRGKDGYKYEGAEQGKVDIGRMGRLHILEVQRLIRFMPKVVIAVVPGWAVGGGHSLHVVCDLTIASKEHAIFKQTDPDVASFDSGYGSALLARQIGQKRAREIFFIGRNYSAQEAFEMGMVNAVVPHAELEAFALEWGREINSKSPTAMKMLKYGFNLPDDGMVGQQLFAGEATRLAYGTEEAQEGRDAFLEKRSARYGKFPWQY
jgi:naphthoate synthase